MADTNVPKQRMYATAVIKRVGRYVPGVRDITSTLVLIGIGWDMPASCGSSAAKLAAGMMST
eukprot:14122076-Alexandrium_andersonii.AAC.1